MSRSSDTATARWARGSQGRRRRAVWLMAVAAWIGPASDGFGQQAKVAWQEGRLYVGDPLLVRVTAADFDEQPQLVCEPGPLPPGLSLAMVDMSPQVSSYTQIINNRVTTSREVVYVFNFHAVAEAPGVYTIPGFTVRQGKRQASTGAANLEVRDIELDRNIRIALVLPGGPVYPGQRVPVTVEWWYAGQINDVRNLNIRSPLFDRFNFIDEPAGREDTLLPIQTEKGTRQLKAQLTRRTLDGLQFVVVSATRRLVVDQPGEHELAPITVNIERVTRWGRDFFGARRPLATVRLRAIGKAQKLTVEPLPRAAAPASFGGAVGQGFTVAVTADRTVVRVGDPITLTITVRGSGNLDNAGLVPLSALAGVAGPSGAAGLDPQWFRLPSADAAGALSKDATAKQFTATIRVLAESVSEVPPIPYSWFDPQTGKYETTYSDPIALRVLPAQVVGAADVVSGSIPGGDPEAPPPVAPDRPTADLRFDLTGADLTIEPDPARLLIDEARRYGGGPALALIYGGSLLLIAVAWWHRRVAEVDLELWRLRRLLKDQLKQIVQAAKFPRQKAASQIAAALRQIASCANGDGRVQIDRLLAECDVLAYAPDADASATIDAGLRDRAITLARTIVDEVDASKVR